LIAVKYKEVKGVTKILEIVIIFAAKKPKKSGIFKALATLAP